MKPLLSVTFLAGLLVAFVSCSKQDGEPAAQFSSEAETEASPTPGTTSARVVPQAAPVNLPPLETVEEAIQQQNYDAAVDTLIQARPAVQQMSEAQRAQYDQQVRTATHALVQAMPNDPKAAAAYERLSRAVVGR